MAGSAIVSRKTKPGATIVVAASDASATSKTRADYICDGTSDEVEILAALNALPSAGGKVLLTEGNFYVKELVPTVNDWILQGTGTGTVLYLPDSSDTYIMRLDEDTYNLIPFEIRDIKFDGNHANQSSTAPLLDVVNTGAAYMKSFVQNCWFYGSKGSGVQGEIHRLSFSNCRFEGNQQHGISHTGASHLELFNSIFSVNQQAGLNAEADTMQDSRIQGCIFRYNETYGIDYIKECTFTGNIVYGNKSDGIWKIQDSQVNCNLIRANEGSGIYYVYSSNLSGNLIDLNHVRGIRQCWGAKLNSNQVWDNSQDGSGLYPEIGLGTGNLIVGNTIGISSGMEATYALDAWQASNIGNIIMGNLLSKGTSGIVNMGGNSHAQIILCNDCANGCTPEQKYVVMKNTSGGTLSGGHVVIISPSKTEPEVKTTTTLGDDKVFGMALATINDDAYGDILTSGATVLLKVDGTDDIAVGDLLGTFTSAGIAAKANAGDMAFAIALEAYTSNDSNGVIDAYLISPRKV